MRIENNKYNVIYIDSPWLFKTYSLKGKEKKSAENHYPTMKIHDIYGLDLKRIAKPDCILFTWVTFPLLQEGIEAINQWGFEYKTNAFTWVKRNKIADSWFWGTGYWTRANAELCLLATIGKPKRISRSVHQVVDERVMRHSKKPQVVRDRIVELCGDVPRIELFARERDSGWDATGFDLDGLDIRDTVGVNILDKESFIRMADEQIEKIKERGNHVYSVYTLNFGSDYRQKLNQIEKHYQDLGYSILTHVCRRRLVDVTIIWEKDKI